MGRPTPLTRGPALPEGLEGDRVALVVLRALPGVGDRIAGRLLVEAGSRREALRRVWEGTGVPVEARNALRAQGRERTERAAAVLRLADRAGIGLLGIDEPAYPSVLAARLPDPPVLLWLRGRWELLGRPAISVVGSRRATQAGRRVATRLAEELAARGYTVVSGMASGIDAAAHRGAVGQVASTVAVLGRGPDLPYPLAESALFEEIAEKGLLVSEFAPRIPVRRHHFPRRNRVLAALSQAVVVVEAAERSGSLLTADHAIDLHIPAMAVPGTADLPTTVGSNGLLRDGAPMVTCADDVVENLLRDGNEAVEASLRALQEARRARRLQAGEESGAVEGGSLGRGGESMGGSAVDPEGGEGGEALPARLLLETLAGQDPVVGQVAGHLTDRPLPVEYLLERSGLPPSRALQALTTLELAGLAWRKPEGWVLGEGGDGDRGAVRAG